MNEKKLSQIVLLGIIFRAGIVELIVLLYTKTMRIHHLGFCALGVIDTIIAFIKHSDYRWCDFAFTLTYFILLTIGLLITI